MGAQTTNGLNDQMEVNAVDFATYLLASAISTTCFANIAFTMIDTLVPLMSPTGARQPVHHTVGGTDWAWWRLCSALLSWPSPTDSPVMSSYEPATGLCRMTILPVQISGIHLDGGYIRRPSEELVPRCRWVVLGSVQPCGSKRRWVRHRRLASGSGIHCVRSRGQIADRDDLHEEEEGARGHKRDCCHAETRPSLSLALSL